MKNLKVKIALVLAMMLTGTLSETVKAQPHVSISFQAFYDDLSPYGSWVSYPHHGYVWIPSAGPGFRPYATNGHWVMTDMGWMWASNYDWGWAPFHYGSWLFDPFYGWMWVPGYQWAPAWVVWGNYDSYYGWAPVAPGFSISIGYRPPIDYWSFMHPRFITAVDYGPHYFYARDRRINITNNTVINNVNNITIVNNTGRTENTAFNAGPRREIIERAGNVAVKPVAIRESTRPTGTRAGSNEVSVYRPRVTKASADVKPRAVTPLEKVKRQPEASPKDRNEASPSRPENGKKTKELSPQIRKENDRQQSPVIRNERKEAPATRPVSPDRKEPAVRPERESRPVKKQPETERKQESARPAPVQREAQQIERNQRSSDPRPSREVAPRKEPQREIRQVERAPSREVNPRSEPRREMKQLEREPAQRQPDLQRQPDQRQPQQPRQEEGRGRKK